MGTSLDERTGLNCLVVAGLFWIIVCSLFKVRTDFVALSSCDTSLV